MPSRQAGQQSRESLLSSDEIIRVCGIFADLGIVKIKITGGEPLVRPGIAGLIRDIASIPGICKVTMTTNGLLLGRFLDEAPFPSLGGINISLDALDENRYRLMTRQEGVKPVDIITLADRLLEKHVPVKINCVPVRGFNEDEIPALAALAKDKYINVRFIELMPLGSGGSLQFVPGNEIAAILEKTFGKLEPYSGALGNGPAVYYSLSGFTGKIGFINPVSHGFCETCNRLRLTPSGFLKLCLSTGSGLDIRKLLRSGISDDELKKAIIETVAKKPHYHTLSGIYGAAPKAGQHSKGMYKIGG